MSYLTFKNCKISLNILTYCSLVNLGLSKLIRSTQEAEIEELYNFFNMLVNEDVSEDCNCMKQTEYILTKENWFILM